MCSVHGARGGADEGDHDAGEGIAFQHRRQAVSVHETSTSAWCGARFSGEPVVSLTGVVSLVDDRGFDGWAGLVWCVVHALSRHPEARIRSAR